MKFDVAKVGGVVVIVLILIYGLLLVRTAWVAEDAYITFRTVDNFIHGYGLTWNIGERVQTYTNPLWMFLVSAAYALTREMFFTVIGLSVFISFLVAWIFAERLAVSWRESVLGLSFLVCSKAFVDYSTSGLENPLTHLFIVVFLAIYWGKSSGHRRIFLLSLVASLAAINRMDTILLFLPALAFSTLTTEGPKKIRALLLGACPFIAWEFFALIYYGFPFPNSFYAKLHTGIGAGELAAQGIFYVFNSVQLDPITLLGLALGIVIALVSKKPDLIFLAAGALFYSAYVVKIGGDFMSGRFFAAPLLLAVAIIARIPQRSSAAVILAVFAVGAVGMTGPYPPLLSNADFVNSKIDEKGIADERGFYYQYAGLLKASRSVHPPTLNRDLAALAKEKGGVMVIGNVGYFGFFAGPMAHIVDTIGITDPLLARLPSSKNPNWRIGHFERAIPEGYVETLEKRNVLLSDGNLGNFYRKLLLITRGRLFSVDRVREIIKMNLGRYRSLIDQNRYRNPPPKK